MRQGKVEILYQGQKLGSFRFRIEDKGKRVYLSKPWFENPDRAPHKVLAELRDVVRRHGREWFKDTRYAFIQTEDKQIETKWIES
jgi:hypothetical protein